LDANVRSRDTGLNPDLAADFGFTALIRALSRWCFGGVSGLKGFA
jgi:hypothetical protein